MISISKLVSPLLILLSLSALPLCAQDQDGQVAKDHAVVEALLRLPTTDLSKNPKQLAAVNRYLSRNVGQGQYISVANQLGIFDRTDELLAMIAAGPTDNIGIEALKLAMRGKQFAALESALTSEDTTIATSVAQALGFVKHPRAIELLQGILSEPAGRPQVRIAAATSLGRNEAGQKFLLNLAQQNPIAEDIRFVVTDSLLGSSIPEIKDAATKVLQAPPTLDSKPLPPLNELVRRSGSASSGQAAFASVGKCNTCHKVLGQGKEVGPDLSEIGDKLSRMDMFVAILNPSAAISHNYETYTVLDEDSQIVSGLLINQTDEFITLRDQEGIDHKFDRQDVVSLKKQDVSLMPANLQQSMSLENLVDIVDYLTTLKKPGASNPDAQQVVQVDTSHDPQRAIAGFEIADGLQVELFAYEPRLYSPTSIDVDAQGRIWVCEAVNYRHFRNHDNQPRDAGDRILVLEDTDGDGKADKETVFYQDREIDSPHGVCVIGDQIIVSAGSNVLVFTDSDGDLKPDSKKVLFSGISGVQHDHGIHAFGIGPDGKLYFNFGNEGKQLKGPAGETIVDLAGNVVDDSRRPYQQGMVFRCNLDGSDLETLGWNFRNNWEVCLDSFGNLWQSDNDDDGNRGTRINFVMEYGNYGYRDEITGASWRASRIGLEDEIPLQHWHLNDPGVVPNILQTGAGSPTGIFFYEGDLLPEPFQNQLLHTDPGPNVVRAYPVEHTGAGYQASIRNLVKGVNDPWFRPVDVCAAPDGSLFVADWYDPGVGGHRMGDIERGRIFRITPTGHEGYILPKLDLNSPEGVVEALQNPNLATRFLAQSRITEMSQQGDAMLEALEAVAKNSPNPRMQARAIWQIARISKTPEKVVDWAIKQSNPDLRIVGIRIARQHQLDMLSLIDRMKSDDSQHVRRELCVALRHQESDRAAELWVDLAMQHDGQDRWYLEALGIAADQQWDTFFEAWLQRVGDDWKSPAGRDIVWRCRSPKACRYLVELIREAQSPEEQYRYFRAFDFHEGEPKLEALNELLSMAQP